MKTEVQSGTIAAICSGAWVSYKFSLTNGVNLRQLKVSSSGILKAELRVNNQVIVVLFSSTANLNVSSDLQLNHVTPNDNVEIRICNYDKAPCDSYFSLVYEDMWEEYSRDFDKQLEDTLTN